MKTEGMVKMPSLHLYVLGHPDREQAAWVRASSFAEASIRLSQESGIPVISSHDYGWVLFPEGQQHSSNEEWPVPHWEYRLVVRGPAALKGMPAYIRALGNRATPKRQGSVSFGPQITRSMPIDERRIPGSFVISTDVFHSGDSREYRITAREMSGHTRDWDNIEIGKIANLLLDEEIKFPVVGDVLKVRLKGDDSDYVVTGEVCGKSILVSVISIERLG